MRQASSGFFDCAPISMMEEEFSRALRSE